MASLYELTNEFLEIYQELEAAELDEDVVENTLESLQLPIEKKAENIIKFAKNLEAMADARKAEAKRLNEVAASESKKAERLLEYLDYAMQRLGKKELMAGIFKASYRKGAEVVEIDESKLPKKYWQPQPPKPISKTELKKMLKENEKIDGVSLVRKPDKLVIK